jgi:hypothetical protein
MMRVLGGLLGATVLGLVLAVWRGRQQAPEERFVCELRALSPEERRTHGALTQRLAAAIRERRQVADGYAFDLDESALDWHSLAEWARFERRCCPFFRVRLEAAPRGGGLQLELGGARGVRRFIEAELPSSVAGS